MTNVDEQNYIYTTIMGVADIKDGLVPYVNKIFNLIQLAKLPLVLM